MAKKAAKLTAYRNNGGVHSFTDEPQPDGTIKPGRTVQKGEAFESDIPNLDTLFPNKFVKIHPSEVQGVATANDKTDVTPDFPLAVEADLTVLHDKAGYWIYDEGEEPLNNKALKRGSVDTFVEDYAN